MYSLKYTVGKYLPFFLVKVIILMVGLNTISCNCKKLKRAGDSVSDFNENVNPPLKGQDKPIDLFLSISSNDVIKGDEPIQLKIINKGTQPTVKRKLKLKAIRIEGSCASIHNATDQGSGEYTINLRTVSAKGNILKDLNIEPDADIRATFRVQLVYEGNEVGNSLNIRWEKGAWVEIGTFRYVASTQHLICNTIKNTGSETAYQVKLVYEIKPSGAARMLHVADSLDPGEKKENQDLGRLIHKYDKKTIIEVKTLFYEKGNKEQLEFSGIATFINP